MWISAGIQVQAEFHYKKLEEKDCILSLFRFLQERFPAAKLVYDGPSKHHGDGNDFVFTAPVHGLMSSANEAKPEELAHKILDLKRALLEALLKELKTDSDEHPPEDALGRLHRELKEYPV